MSCYWRRAFGHAARTQILRLRSAVVRAAPRQQVLSDCRRRSTDHGGTFPVPCGLQDYFDWLKRPYYLALQSAAASYGSMPQAVQVTQVMTDKPRRDLRIGRIRVNFFVKRYIVGPQLRNYQAGQLRC